MSTDDIIQKAIKQFLQELENSEAEYEKVSHNEHVSIYRKLDNTIGIYRIKVVGTIPHPVDIVDKVLFDNELRVLWDTIFETMQEVDTLDNGSSVIYIAAKSPPGISNRDMIHIRTRKELPSNQEFPNEKRRLILDVSTEHDQIPLREDYVRAHTVFSGGVLESCDMTQKQIGTKYTTIALADIKGSVPTAIVNMVMSKQSLEWFGSVIKACDLYVKGQLHP